VGNTAVCEDDANNKDGDTMDHASASADGEFRGLPADDVPTPTQRTAAPAGLQVSRYVIGDPF